jgi:hypothetical protein
VIALAGATGYVGGRLLTALEGEGRAVRCIARRPGYLRGRVAHTTTVVAGDLPGSGDAAGHARRRARRLLPRALDGNAGVRLGTRLIDDRSIHVDRPAAAAFAPIRRIGGDRGWYYADWLWRPATPSTSGASNRSSPTDGCVWRRR